MERQRGIGFLGVFFLLVLLIIGAIIGMKLVPAYIEFFSVKRIIKAMKSEIEGASVRDIKAAFDRRASTDYITSVKGADLDISKAGGKVVVTAAYEVRIPLFANISVVLDFNTSTSE
jgi:Domain of unknown function (DUF4845)